ncbi:hypothetical protein [Xylanimonas ulmi]|uniref:Uncharacterized protein n=1 Tax=Xylanimonas ulmi TaxID=228973 RepID=A0A4Q7M003_9MICO|nr:hypothetical protein [Xylanibacterium ulmi]RZS61046.1 hypothetical protein EV386_1327 [Xylanibacterium ulmi]
MTAAEIAPIAGNPDAVRAGAGAYAQTAAALAEAAAAIRALARQPLGTSDAVTELVGIADEVAGRLDGLNQRYSTAGSELTVYAAELEDAQQRASQAVQTRDAVVGPLANAEAHAERYAHQARTVQDPTSTQEAVEQSQRWSWQARDLAAQLDQASVRHARARADLDAAADRAAAAIAAAVDRDGMNDSGWDNFTGWVSEHADLLKTIKDVLSAIAAGLAIAGMFFPVLLPFAALAGGLAAVAGLGLALAGEISWVEFGLDALTAITFGVGAIAARGLRVTMTALKNGRLARGFRDGGGKLIKAANRSQRSKLGARQAVDEWASLAKEAATPSAAKHGPLQWLWQLKGHKTLENLRYAKILKEMQTGAWGAKDAALAAKATQQLEVAKRFSLIGAVAGAPGKAADAAANVADVADRVEDAMPRIDTDWLGDPARWVSSRYDQLVQQPTTHRAGSGW